MTDSLFPIDYMVEMDKIMSEKFGNVCKMRWNGKSMDLEVIKVNLSEENKKLYSRRMDMIGFVAKCRDYSEHLYKNCKFFYRFKKNKYGDRIGDIIREF